MPPVFQNYVLDSDTAIAWLLLTEGTKKPLPKQGLDAFNIQIDEPIRG